jgi:hypothetical protein
MTVYFSKVWGGNIPFRGLNGRQRNALGMQIISTYPTKINFFLFKIKKYPRGLRMEKIRPI